MIVELLDIFADDGDKARLITVLITSLFAFLFLLLNQHFNFRKERREFLIKKIEELTFVADEFFSSAETILILSDRYITEKKANLEIPNPSDLKELTLQHRKIMLASKRKIGVYCRLHFMKEVLASDCAPIGFTEHPTLPKESYNVDELFNKVLDFRDENDLNTLLSECEECRQNVTSFCMNLAHSINYAINLTWFTMFFYERKKIKFYKFFSFFWGVLIIVYITVLIT